MEDFTLCPGRDCPRRQTCMRYIWGNEKPKEIRYRWEIDTPEQPCDIYIPMMYYGG